MARNSGDFDEDEGFFESLMKRRDEVPMPASMMKLFSIVAGGAVLLIVALVAWAVWPSGTTTSDDAVPVVRAEEGEYKVKPDEPGGMPIPNKDSTIFESMDSDKSGEKKVENLLEDEEQPLKKEEVFEEAAPAVAAEPAPVETEEVVKAEEPKVEEKKVEAKVEAKVEKAPVAEEKKPSVIQTLKEEAGTAKETSKSKAVSSGTSYIQLAAVKSDAEAKAKWAKLQLSYASLKPLSMRVQKADLGAKGVFYRVQAGPVSAADATSICAKIKAAGGACIIAK